MTDTYNVIGLMSGTSLDGLDMVFCSFNYQNERWSFELRGSKNIDYEEVWRQRLKTSIALSALDLLLLNNDYGKWLGEQVRTFIKEQNIDADFVASHGHTVLHQPDKKATYQIGDGQHIANICGLKVICDFRSKDVSLGGQGAPLVPIGDKYLFSEYDFCLNLGGISNVSFDYKGERVAYDIGLANMVLNYLTNQMGLLFDEGGKIARSGALDDGFFNELNNLPYYSLPFPKSTGFEWFCDEVVPIVDKSNKSVEDKLHTAVHHIAFTVAKDIGQYTSMGSKLLVTGGGVKNTFLVECLKNHLGDSIEVIIPDSNIIGYKEAIVFAFLGVLRQRGEANCLKSVTGAREDSSGGVVFY